MVSECSVKNVVPRICAFAALTDLFVLGIPMSFHVIQGSIVEEDKESVDSQGIPRAVNNNKYWFEMQLLDDQGKVAKMLQSEVKPGGGNIQSTP